MSRQGLPSFMLFLGAALALWLWPSVFGGKVLVPLDIVAHNPPHVAGTDKPVHNALIGDMVFENYTWKLFQRRALEHGELPLWNPAAFCGHPLYTTGQTSTFYPLNVLFLVLPTARAYVVHTWLHLMMAGVFTWLLFRRLGVGPFGCAAGGVTAAMGGMLATRLLWPMLLGSAVWLPLMLLWIDRAADVDRPGGRAGGLFWGSILFAQPILSGFFEIAFYVMAACGLYALVAAGRMAAARRPVSCWGPFLGRVAAATLLGAALSAPQVLPFLEVMKRNVRAGELDYAAAVRNGCVPVELWNAIMPDALGNPARHACLDLRAGRFVPARQAVGDDSPYFGPRNYVESHMYVGLVALAAAALGIGAGGTRRLEFGLLAAISLALAFTTPLYAVFFHLVPGADQVRSPHRWILPALFALTYFVALGADRWHARLTAVPGRAARGLAVASTALAGVLVLAVMAAFFLPDLMEQAASAVARAVPRAGQVLREPRYLAGHLWLNLARLAVVLAAGVTLAALAWLRAWSRRQVPWLCLAMLSAMALDHGQATAGFWTHSDPGMLADPPPLVRRMQADPDLFRIGRFGPEKVLYANTPSIYGLQDFGGYDSVILGDFAAFMQALEPQNLLPYNIVMLLERPATLDAQGLRLLDLRYLLASRPIDHPDWERIDADAGLELYRLRPQRRLGRAFMVPEIVPVPDRGAALAALASGRIDVARTVLLEVEAQAVAGLTGDPAATPGRAVVEHYSPGTVRVRTDAPTRQVLVLCDVHYPGWQVRIDGRPAEMHKAYGVFRGVSVPPGGHTVEFRFRPPLLRVGAAVAAGALVLAAVPGVVRRRRGGA